MFFSVFVSLSVCFANRFICNIFLESISSVQSLSRVRLFAHQASLFITNSQSPPKPMFIVLVMPSNCRPLLLLPSTSPSIKVFSNESALRIRWPKDCSFNFNISPSKEHPRLISFRMDWLETSRVDHFQHEQDRCISPEEDIREKCDSICYIFLCILFPFSQTLSPILHYFLIRLISIHSL